MLQAKTKEQREYVEDVLSKHMNRENEYCRFIRAFVPSNDSNIVEINLLCVDCGNEMSVDIPFVVMKQIVEFLKFRIRKGYLYKCKKDVYDNSGEVCLFNKDEIYLSPEDNFLISNNDARVVFQEWHKPQELFKEVDEIETEKE